MHLLSCSAKIATGKGFNEAFINKINKHLAFYNLLRINLLLIITMLNN